MKNVLIIGNQGNFGKFLEHTLLQKVKEPLNITEILGYDLELSAKVKQELIRNANHIILSVSLGRYHTVLKELLDELVLIQRERYLWLIPTIQLPSHELINEYYLKIQKALIHVSLIHPMYGPQSFSNSSPEIRKNFQTIVTYHSSEAMQNKIRKLESIFESNLNIPFQYQFSPSLHDEEVAKTQGLIFIFALNLLQRPIIKEAFRELFPKQLYTFEADKNLMIDFVSLNQKASELKQEYSSILKSKSSEEPKLGDLFTTFSYLDKKYNVNTQKVDKIFTESYLTLSEYFNGAGN